MTSLVSPELALVDPSLRSDAVADLPQLEPFDFLRFERVPRRAAVPQAFTFLTHHADVAPPPWQPPLLVAASLYAVSAAARMVVMDGLFVLALAAAVLVVNVIG